MSNIIDKIQVSGVTYDIGGSGGGKAIEAGRGIAITTGETADTVSFNLPISAGTGTNSVIEGSTSNFASGYASHAEGNNTRASGYASHAEGNNTRASGQYSHAEGYSTEASGEGSHAEGTSTSTKYYSHGEGSATFAIGNYAHAEGDGTTATTESSHAEGRYTVTKNNAEHASGQYNNSVSASTTFGDSGNTLFSVGNGTSSSARHNAFEIRQNGDIYLSSGGTDIKLQDHLGGGGGGGNPTVELTQAEYEALVTAGTVSADTYYIITDAQAGDLTQYWTSAQTQSAITQATSGKASQSDLETVSGQVANKQDLLVSGTNIKTINNESLLGSGNIDIQGGGGGKAIEGGRGISITTGETADTVSFNLPISAGTGIYSIIEGRSTIASGSPSHAEGSYTKANGDSSHAEGDSTKANGDSSHAEGIYTQAIGNYSHAEGVSTKANGSSSHAEGSNTIANNKSEHASGQYNNSVSGSSTFGDSGNTLFSVGNGTSSSARHNAFEIRQNGDIYFNDGTNDVKLQDKFTEINNTIGDIETLLAAI